MGFSNTYSIRHDAVVEARRFCILPLSIFMFGGYFTTLGLEVLCRSLARQCVIDEGILDYMMTRMVRPHLFCDGQQFLRFPSHFDSGWTVYKKLLQIHSVMSQEGFDRCYLFIEWMRALCGDRWEALLYYECTRHRKQRPYLFIPSVADLGGIGIMN